jgi:hypothetical protein
MSKRTPVIGLPPEQLERSATYPREAKAPHRRCPLCGRFLRWDDYFGQYLDHASWDSYMGAWEATCE